MISSSRVRSGRQGEEGVIGSRTLTLQMIALTSQTFDNLSAPGAADILKVLGWRQDLLSRENRCGAKCRFRENERPRGCDHSRVRLKKLPESSSVVVSEPRSSNLPRRYQAR